MQRINQYALDFCGFYVSDFILNQENILYLNRYIFFIILSVITLYANIHLNNIDLIYNSQSRNEYQSLLDILTTIKSSSKTAKIKSIMHLKFSFHNWK